MKPVLCAWWGVLAALLVVPLCWSRPSPDSESESWQPISGHRVNRYRSDPSLNLGQYVPHGPNNLLEIEGLTTNDCLNQFNSLTEIDNLAKLLCFSLSNFVKGYLLQKDVRKTTYIKTRELSDNSRSRPLSTMEFGRKIPLYAFQNKNSFNDSIEQVIANGRDPFGSGSPRQRRRRSARQNSRRTRLKTTAVKLQEPADDGELEWLPVPLAPPKREVGFTKTSLVNDNLVTNFVSNSLSDLKLPQQSSGALVQIISPLMSKHPGSANWGSVSLDDLIISHTTETIHHKPTMWHKRPSVILVQDAPETLLPKPPQHHNNHHVPPSPEPHVPYPSPEPFPRPTYHFPRPSPEPPPSPMYHYPSSEPTPKPVHHYSPSTSKPVHHYHSPEPQFPYTSVIIHTSTNIQSDPYPDEYPDPTWDPIPQYPSDNLVQEPEDPYPKPEIVIGSEDPITDPSTELPPAVLSPSGSPFNPVTISSGQRPPSILILSPPEEPPAASSPLADPIAPPAAAGGGGLIPIIPIVPPVLPVIAPPIVPGLLGAVGSGASSVSSDCPSVQVFNVQTFTNSLENKDCVINVNSAVHNVNSDDQLESPSDILYDDVPDSSTVATTTKKPSGGSMTVFEYLHDFFASLTLFNPISLSFWSFLFAPVSILLASGLGIAALVLPWISPSYWFGRRSYDTKSSVNHVSYSNLRDSALRFERSLQSGVDLDDFLKNIGLLRHL